MAQKKADTPFDMPEIDVEATQKTPKVVLGFEWSKFPNVDKELELCLWNADVVDIDDINTKPQRVFAALQAYFRVHLGALRQAVKEYKANVNG